MLIDWLFGGGVFVTYAGGGFGCFVAVIYCGWCLPGVLLLRGLLWIFAVCGFWV